jgi:hypothetical protein
MTDERTWLHHPETGGHFHCPVEAVEAWLALGWQVADAPPPEPNPAIEGLLEWRRQQAAEAESAATQPSAAVAEFPAPTRATKTATVKKE